MDELQREILKKFKIQNQTWSTAVSDAINKEEAIDLGAIQGKSVDIITEIAELFIDAKKRNKKTGFFK